VVALGRVAQEDGRRRREGLISPRPQTFDGWLVTMTTPIHRGADSASALGRVTLLFTRAR